LPELPGARAVRVLESDIEAFEQAGCRLLERRGSHEAVLTAPGTGARVILRLSPVGRVFGGNWGLEVTTDEALLPETAGGLAARGRGVIKLQGVRFRPRQRGDADAARLAQALSTDRRLGDALGRVHFERIWVRRDGHPVIRHLGGSVVWVLFPPVVRSTPLPEGQAAELLRALEAFRDAGRVLDTFDV
jgi:Protein of unknown function (DUF3156)